MINADRGLELLVVASLKGTLVLVIAWALMTILKRASASVRHWICSLALVSTIAIPLLQLAAPVWFVPILPNASNPSDNVTVAPNPDNSLLGMNTHLSGMGQSTVASVPQPTGKISKPTARSSSIVPVPTQQNIPGPDALAIDFSLSALVLALWLIGGLIALTRWFEQAYRVWRITRRGTLLADVAWSTLRDRTAYQSNINRAIRLVLSDEVTVPLTWGIWQPTVVLPVAALDWSCERSQIVLVHELAHIARWDYLTQWLALISCAINWFNPFVWNMARLLSEAREQACDDRVLTMGTKSSDYAVNLLEISQAIQHKWTASSGFLAMGQSSNLGKRIHRILDMGQSRSALTRTRSLMFVLLLAIAILPRSTM